MTVFPKGMGPKSAASRDAIGNLMHQRNFTRSGTALATRHPINPLPKGRIAPAFRARLETAALSLTWNTWSNRSPSESSKPRISRLAIAAFIKSRFFFLESSIAFNGRAMSGVSRVIVDDTSALLSARPYLTGCAPYS
jgi:hypothetical protein